MASLSVGADPPKRFVESRESALERLLLVVCEELLPDDLAELGDDKLRLAEKVTNEAAFWLDFVPRGSVPEATEPATRLGYARVAERRREFERSESLVPATKKRSR